VVDVKKLAPVLVVALLLAVMALLVMSRARQQNNLTILTGNQALQAVPIVLGHYQDTQCGMTIDQLQDSAQAVAPDGRTWFFDDVGCLALWLKTNRQGDKMTLWVYTRDTETWVDGRQAWFTRTAQTTMEYGFAAYAASGDDRVDFDTMFRLMARGENLTNPYTRKELLGND
jgi:hypothetical protein